MTTSSFPHINTASYQNIFTKVQQATDWLKQGKLLVYPTESVWGIGCDPFNQTAVQTLLTLKNRPLEKGLIIICDTIHRLHPFLSVLTSNQQQHLKDTWSINLANSANQQRAHTWLLPLTPMTTLPTNIPQWITGGHDNVAIRVIAHPLIQQLCQQMVSDNNPYGFVVSTSCNPTGKPPAMDLKQAVAYFDNSHFADSVGYLQGQTLGYTLPSQIGDICTGQVLR